MWDALAETHPALAERVEVLASPPARSSESDFVVYWIHHALRGHENPALNIALHMGRALGLPVLVYQAVSAWQPYASDRLLSFELQAGREVQAELASRGVAFACHVVRSTQEERVLLELADRAALVVTDAMPVEPVLGWQRRLAQHATGRVGLWSVDTSCVVPMTLSKRGYDRAFAFRRATQNPREQRLWQELPEVEPDRSPASWAELELPFEPVDLSRADIAELVAGLPVDHAVGPVAHTPGGSEAGYERWAAFRDERLDRYAADRNDAAKPQAVSRMSAYLHHGCVSPFRLAREAARIGGKGAEKWLDEMLVWREMAFHFCHHASKAGQDLDSVTALPDWARQTLHEHADDERPADLSWEALARAQSGDPLWDTAQLSLLRHGELHNNVRMSWGKQILAWTDSPQRALRLMLDLNHRYALDGRDPNSYGGILWCLGQFDRPFKPPQPIFGTVRHRSTEQHAQRLDLDAFASQTAAAPRNDLPRVGVVGGGIAGLFAARTLQDHGFSVTVLDKARGPGGRMAHRRGEPALRFDHGCVSFTARDSHFARYVQAWQHDGIVAEWHPRQAEIHPGGDLRARERDDAPRYVGVPGMTAVGKHLAAGLNYQRYSRVEAARFVEGQWRLIGQDSELGRYDAVVLTVPAPQARELLGRSDPLATRLEAAGMQPTLTVMAGFDRGLDLPFDLAKVRDLDSPLEMITRNSSKPRADDRRDGLECWTIHAKHEFSAEHLEADYDTIAELLLEALRQLLNRPDLQPSHVVGHRWRYAFVDPPLGDACLFDPDRRLALAGDWCLGPRVEAGFLSGMAAAGRIMGQALQPDAHHHREPLAARHA